MASGAKNSVEAANPPANERHLPPEKVNPRRRGELRLAISIPAVLVLFTLVHGLISLKILDGQWDLLVRSGETETAARLLRGQIYSIVILSVAACAAGLILSLAILRPLRSLQETVQKVTLGNLDLRAPRTNAAPELGDLSRSFNSLIEFVHESIQERDRYLIEGMGTGILTADASGRITTLNSTGAEILGLESSAVVGRSIEDLRANLPEAYHPIWVYLEKSLRREQTRMLEEVALNGGASGASLLIAMSLLRDGTGRPSGVMLNFRDAAEIRNLTDHLRKTDQLAALGTFTMGLAHELRNPLGSIKGLVQLLTLQGRTPAEGRDYLDRVVHEVNRLDRFIKELFDFCNQSSSEPVVAELGELLRAAAVLARGEPDQFTEKKIKIVEDFGLVPSLLVEPDRLMRAFGNVIRNAYEAAEEGGTITLRTFLRAEGMDDYAVASVHNTGSTVEAAHCARIFEPFFTTKDKGTGLGLAIAYQIITGQRGSLDFSVEPNGVELIARFKVGGRDEIFAAGAKSLLPARA